jgi:hypothetical protein
MNAGMSHALHSGEGQLVAQRRRTCGFGGMVTPALVLCAMLLSILGLARPAEALPVLSAAEAPTPAVCPESCLGLAGAPAAAVPGPLAWYGIASAVLPAPLPVAGALDANVAPIPIPAAGWLLIAGLGALGLFHRRRRDTPLRPALRASARTDFAASRHGPVRLFPAALPALDLRRGRALRSERLNAFAPGRATPARPAGGAGILYAAIAERAPPRDLSRAVLPAMVDSIPTGDGFCVPRHQDRETGAAASALFVPESKGGEPPGEAMVRDHACGAKN